MPKRRGQDNQNQHSNGASADKRSRPAPRRKHLYLVLDDWKKGFSVYKIDTDSFDSDSDDDQSPRVPFADRLPDPPALRLEIRGDGDMLFTTMGSKIFAVTDASYGQTPALVYNTETAGLAIGPAIPAHLQCGFSIVVAVTETLYAFSSPAFNNQQSFQVMSWALNSLHDQNTRYPSEEGRSWRSLPMLPPPYNIYEIVTSYAVHPDGQTIFMTTSYRDRPNLQRSTYSFNIKYCVWRWHDWVLPFRGQGHFDSELDAWVGLNMDDDICCCQVPSDIGSETPVELGTAQLDWQIVQDRFFPKKTERLLRASLTYMGRNKFCLVQSVIRKGAKERYPVDDDDACVLHLTMFGLKYSRKGELCATNRRSTCSYQVSRHKDYFSPQAFWV